MTFGNGLCLSVFLNQISDVNSRFICKGPIHKLLNQLAAKFDLSNSWKPTTDSVFEKQNRCHLIPTFILNLNCPRSYYDIVTSDRSRTTVEFKVGIPCMVILFQDSGLYYHCVSYYCFPPFILLESWSK